MTDERFKGGVHAVAMALACTMGLHNLKEACSERRRPRHVFNALLYLCAVPFEAWNTYDHWRQP